MKAIEIKKTPKQFFRAALMVLKPLPKFSQLRDKEMDILAELYYYNHLFRDTPESNRNTLLFSSSTKKEIGENTGSSIATIDNIISCLKDKDFIIGDRSTKMLNPNYILKVTDNEIIYRFIIND